MDDGGGEGDVSARQIRSGAQEEEEMRLVVRSWRPLLPPPPQATGNEAFKAGRAAEAIAAYSECLALDPR